MRVHCATIYEWHCSVLSHDVFAGISGSDVDRLESQERNCSQVHVLVMCDAHNFGQISTAAKLTQHTRLQAFVEKTLAG